MRFGSLLMIVLCGTSYAASFVNGSFETGDFTGWTQGAGFWNTPGSYPVPSTYLPGGPNYDISYNASDVVTSGLDPRTDNNLNMVYGGTYSARVNNNVNNYSVSAISQTVVNYTDPTIFFAWAAVLQESHGATDSDNFTLQLTNDTKGLTLYQVNYNSATARSGLFTQSSSGWFYTDWQVQSLDVSAFAGDTFTLTLLGSDCPYGGHAGYVYLDGFGAVNPPPGGEVPEPSTLAFTGLGFAAAALVRRLSK